MTSTEEIKNFPIWPCLVLCPVVRACGLGSGARCEGGYYSGRGLQCAEINFAALLGIIEYTTHVSSLLELLIKSCRCFLTTFCAINTYLCKSDSNALKSYEVGHV